MLFYDNWLPKSGCHGYYKTQMRRHAVSILTPDDMLLKETYGALISIALVLFNGLLFAYIVAIKVRTALHRRRGYRIYGNAANLPNWLLCANCNIIHNRLVDIISFPASARVQNQGASGLPSIDANWTNHRCSLCRMRRYKTRKYSTRPEQETLTVHRQNIFGIQITKFWQQGDSSRSEFSPTSNTAFLVPSWLNFTITPSSLKRLAEESLYMEHNHNETSSRASGSVDLHSIRSWLQNCKDCRPSRRFRKNRLTKSNLPLYIIDCIERTVVAAPWDATFCALSYVC